MNKKITDDQIYQIYLIATTCSSYEEICNLSAVFPTNRDNDVFLARVLGLHALKNKKMAGHISPKSELIACIEALNK